MTADDEGKPEPGEDHWGGDQPQLPTAEQLRVQTELARDEVYKRTRAPPGKTRQLLVVMRHGERIDEVDDRVSVLITAVSSQLELLNARLHACLQYR